MLKFTIIVGRSLFSMVEAYKKMWTNYGNFRDRTTRRDYWLTFLMNLIIGFALGFLSGLTKSNIFSYISTLYSIVMIIPGIALTVRRLHDTNRSGGWWFISLVPLVGAIVLLIFTVSESVTENNNYGIQL